MRVDPDYEPSIIREHCLRVYGGTSPNVRAEMSDKEREQRRNGAKLKSSGTKNRDCARINCAISKGWGHSHGNETD